jgi:hypothetical protein
MTSSNFNFYSKSLLFGFSIASIIFAALFSIKGIPSEKELMKFEDFLEKSKEIKENKEESKKNSVEKQN